MSYELPNKHKSKPISAVFVLTPGRSGSFWLAWAFQQFYYSVVSLHEPGAMIEDMAFQYYHGAATEQEVIDSLWGIRVISLNAARLHMKKTHYIEVGRNLFSLSLPIKKALSSQYTQVMFLGLVGSGKVFVRSMTNEGAYVQHKPYGWFVPSGHPDWDSYSQIKKLSYHWVEKVQCIRRSMCDIHRIEDLTGSRVHWNAMASSIGLPPLRSQVEYDRVASIRINHTPCNTYTTFDDISQADQDTFWSIAGDTMKELGYQ